MRNDIDRETVESFIERGASKSEICRYFICHPATLERKLADWGVEYAGNRGSRGKPSKHRKSAKEYVRKKSGIKAHKLKLKLIEDGIKGRYCEQCTYEMWEAKPIPLELHHIDGDRHNNALNNLRILCPNCHAQTDSYRGKNVGRYEE